MKYLFVTALALASAAFTNASSSLRATNNQRDLQGTFPAWNQQCRDDAGPPFMDDSETFGTNKYHTGKPALAVGDCPDPLKEACATKPKTEAFLEGPINCGGKGWFCRIHEQPGWPNIVLNTDVNFGYCNTTEGFNDPGWDRSGHCHGSDSDDTFYWWVRDHWHRQYNGRLRCCCGWDDVNAGTIVNRCDHRRLVTPDENLDNCRDANEEGVSPYNGGCDANNSPALNEPIPENDAICWEVQNFGEPGDGDDVDNTPDEPDQEEEEPDQEEEEEEPDQEEEEPDQEEEEEQPDQEEEEQPDQEEEEEEPDQEEEEEEPDQEEEEEQPDQEDEEEEPDQEEEEEEQPDQEDEEEEEPDQEEEEEEEEPCEDDPSFRFKGKNKKTCGWVGKKNARKKRLCRKKFVARSCPQTCGACSSDIEVR